MPGISDALKVNTRPGSTLNANAPGSADDAQASNFVTLQSLATFAGATSALSTIWAVIHASGWGEADSHWVPLALSMIFAVWQASISTNAISRPESGQNPLSKTWCYGRQMVSLLVIATLNGAALAAALIGLKVTVV